MIKKLSSYSESRWNSLYSLVHSFNISVFYITLLYEHKEKEDESDTKPYDDTDIQFFQEFEILLRYFKDSIDLFESDSFGQISKAHFELESLKDSVLRFVQNSPFFGSFTENIRDSIKTCLNMMKESWGPLIYAAALLHPKHKYSSALTQKEKNLGLEFIKQFIEDQPESDIYDDVETSSQREYMISHQ